MKSKSPQPNNFAFLLTGLILLILLPPCLRLFVADKVDTETQWALLLMGFSLYAIISVWSLYQNRWFFLIGLALALLNTALVVVLFLHNQIIYSDSFTINVFLIVTLFSVLNCFSAGRYVFSWQHSDANSLIGAVCIYLLLGFIYALLYTMFCVFWPQGAFQGMVFANETIHFDRFLYFSFVTLTTSGYGDITPLNPLLRTLAFLEMITGQFYMAVLVSGLVAHFIGLRMSR